MRNRPRISRVRQDNGAPPPPPDAAPAQPAPTPVPAEFQARIDALFGRAKESAEDNERLRKENEALKAEVIAAKERSALPTRNAPTPAPTPDGSTSHGGGAPRGTVESAVEMLTKQVGEIYGALQAERTARQQQDAFAKAKQLVPGIAAGDKELISAAGKILASDPVLQSHPMGPALAAALAAQMKAVGPVPPTPEQRAGAMTPTPSGASVVPPPELKELNDLRALETDLTARCQGSGGSDHWIRLKETRVKIGALERKLKGQ